MTISLPITWPWYKLPLTLLCYTPNDIDRRHTNRRCFAVIHLPITVVVWMIITSSQDKIEENLFHY
jgi:hypothetical protein